jgi:predicted metal-dependent hydrolase
LDSPIENAAIQAELFDFSPRPAVPEEPSPVVTPEVQPAPQRPLLVAEPEWTPPPIVFERNVRAKHYRLTLRRDGVAVATIPVRGSEKAARAFVAANAEWLERTREKQRLQPRLAERWSVGTRLLWRGEMGEIRRAGTDERPAVCLAADVFRVSKYDGNLRPTLESAFMRRAKIELTSRTWELAARTGMAVTRVGVRNQRTRWGSCTEAGVISLNWRLVQCPEFVSDYIIYHELMHLREMNHSKRFWQAVGEVCPEWETAEAWLKEHGSLLGL